MQINSSQSEIVAIADRNNQVVGKAYRSIMRKYRMIHRAVFIFVLNSEGRLFIQKRSPLKDLYPGYYDLTTSGVVLYEETYLACAYREIREELGISNPEFEALFDFYTYNDSNRVWGHVYKCIYDGNIILQEEEVESGEFYTISDVQRLIKTERVTLESIIAYNRWQRNN